MQLGSSNISFLHLHRDQILDQRFGAGLCCFGSWDQALPALRGGWQSYKATENRGGPSALRAARGDGVDAEGDYSSGWWN